MELKVGDLFGYELLEYSLHVIESVFLCVKSLFHLRSQKIIKLGQLSQLVEADLGDASAEFAAKGEFVIIGLGYFEILSILLESLVVGSVGQAGEIELILVNHFVFLISVVITFALVLVGFL